MFLTGQGFFKTLPNDGTTFRINASALSIHSIIAIAFQALQEAF